MVFVDYIRPSMLAITRKHWDVYISKGLCKEIHGFQFRVDIGGAKPICFRIPSYGEFEAETIKNLCDVLQ